MRIVGIIAEYNPFHTGHEYQIQRAKELSGADYAVVVMSPDYVQRGTPAIFDKYTRARMALRCGADLVLELPVCYATGSAEYFAEGAVRLLDDLGVVDTLCFGVETVGSLDSSASSAAADDGMLQTVARILIDEPETYRFQLREGLREGLTYPQAREAAVKQYIREGGYSVMSDDCEKSAVRLLSSPNNILAVEYCKALMKLHSGMLPLPVSRRGNSYSELSLDGEFCSASALRQALENGKAGILPEQVCRYIPERIQSLFSDACLYPLFADDFRPLLTQKLIVCESLERIFDLSPELARRIRHLRFRCIGKSTHEIITLLKTKQITEARVRRAMLHLLLDIQKESVESLRREGGVYYAHILGFRADAAWLLHEIKRKSSLPMIAKAACASKQLSEAGRQMWAQDVAASHLYRAIRTERYGVRFRTEEEISPIREGTVTK